MKKKIAVAGSGFAGAVIARELAETGLYEITVFEERDHLAGNCHTARDHNTGVMVHQYGPHIFNTNSEEVWNYARRWGKFEPFVNRIKAVTERGIFSLPINLLTINQFFGKTMNPAEARRFLASLGDSSIGAPRNLEEQALKFLGRELYENFFYGYTRKQWGTEPRELPASILQRLPVRFNYDDNYYNNRYQGIPADGYTALIERMLDHPDITLHLRRPFSPREKTEWDHVFFSGPLDAWFDFRAGRLPYRSLTFERFEAEGDWQGNAIINYCQEEVPFTRITEHKHFAAWESHERTVCFREYSKAAAPGDIPYYPLRLAEDKALLREYVGLADRERGVTFIGRLATYRYLDMHVVIGESLELARRLKILGPDTASWPAFSARPL